MRYTHFLTTCLLAAICAPVYSQIDPDLVGSCEIGQAEAYLDIGNVRARLFNSGNLFWRGSPHVYEVPKGSGKNATFADNFLIGGMVDGELRVAGSSYTPSEFWPGPIPEDGQPPTDCSTYDRIWSIGKELDFDPLGLGELPTQAVLDWPIDLGAHFEDLDLVPGYSPETGDRPLMLGDQMHWWIMNDLGNEHIKTKTNPLGVEVRVTAFAFDTDNDLGNTTFYRYEITNRSTSTIRETYAGRFADVDLGNPWDDNMGSDSTLSLLYFYNADNFDEGGEGYGTAPPAFGFTIIEASHSRGGLPTDVGGPPGSFMTHISGPDKSGGTYGDPYIGDHYYRYMSGFWKNGDRLTYGIRGRDQSARPTNYIFSGDPVTRSYWSQLNADNQGQVIAPSDKRMIGSYGPFTLEPDDTATFTFAYVWARGADHLDSVTKLKAITAELHEAANALLTPRIPRAPIFIDGNPPEKPGYAFWLSPPWPNPSSGQTTMEYSISQDGPVSIDLYDSLSRYVANIESTTVEAGRYFANFNTGNLAPGVYTIRLVSLHHVESIRLVVL